MEMYLEEVTDVEEIDGRVRRTRRVGNSWRRRRGIDVGVAEDDEGAVAKRKPTPNLAVIERGKKEGKAE
ncbi:hypothetical protein TSUD_200920 [Trifolium subterraneum]|uniref:Uncharacterized protein n=1 Tax=Trifolium subterraneum TaxID=3900 RepID=A0A2Z6MDH9_TRISU|nr:hypothetical protein TSUD_200920 [Trifolium subterraneum]